MSRCHLCLTRADAAEPICITRCASANAKHEEVPVSDHSSRIPSLPRLVSLGVSTCVLRLDECLSARCARGWVFLLPARRVGNGHWASPLLFTAAPLPDKMTTMLTRMLSYGRNNNCLYGPRFASRCNNSLDRSLDQNDGLGVGGESAHTT